MVAQIYAYKHQPICFENAGIGVVLKWQQSSLVFSFSGPVYKGTFSENLFFLCVFSTLIVLNKHERKQIYMDFAVLVESSVGFHARQGCQIGNDRLLYCSFTVIVGETSTQRPGFEKLWFIQLGSEYLCSVKKQPKITVVETGTYKLINQVRIHFCFHKLRLFNCR